MGVSSVGPAPPHVSLPAQGHAAEPSAADHDTIDEAAALRPRQAQPAHQTGHATHRKQTGTGARAAPGDGAASSPAGSGQPSVSLYL